MSDPTLTPAQLRELAAAADDLARRITEAHAALRTDPDEHRRRTGFRLEDAAGECRRVAEQLHATAGDLARIAAVPETACAIPWGVCPQHGATLTSTGGRTWCTATGCGRQWGYDRMTGPCPEPVTHTVADSAGDTSKVCGGHAVAAREQLIDGTITPLTR